MATGVVREWHDDEGWGVLDSDETPGGCWAHFSNLEMPGFRRATPGQRVTFTWEQVDQDGLSYRALDVTLDGVPRVEAESHPLGPAYRSDLSIDEDGQARPS